MPREQKLSSQLPLLVVAGAGACTLLYLGYKYYSSKSPATPRRQLVEEADDTEIIPTLAPVNRQKKKNLSPRPPNSTIRHDVTAPLTPSNEHEVEEKDYNSLWNYVTLKNDYYILRHGESEAQLEHLITSNPLQCVNTYGLTEKGKQQVLHSIDQFKPSLLTVDRSIHIYTSDFLRAQQTAKIVCNQLNIPEDELNICEELRERAFGIYNGKSMDNYEKIWTLDATNDHEHLLNKTQVESTRDVIRRTTKLIANLEKLYSNDIILLVSHGDTLQILQTAFEKNVKSIEHRQAIKHLETGEIRHLKYKDTTVKI